MYDKQKTLSDYKLLLKRVKVERDYIEELFRHVTIRLLCFKYSYYVSNKHLVKDNQYDGEEYEWYLLGRSLGKIRKDETSPCVGFDNCHPLAKEGIELHSRLKRKADT